MTSNTDHQQFFDRLDAHPGNDTALSVRERCLSYAQLRSQYYDFAASLLSPDQSSLEEERIALILPAGFNYTIALFGIWRAGGVAVPLNVNTPRTRFCTRLPRLV